MKFRSLTILSFVFLWVTGTQSQAAEFRFVVNAPGSFPYLFLDPDSQQYRGMVVDFFKGLRETENIHVRYDDSNQLRSERLLLNGEADFYLVNPAWLRQPQRLVFSEPLLSHKTFLYALHPFPEDFSLSEVDGAIICTREKFVYTGLTHLFEQDRARRADSASHIAMLKMLEGKRCDYAVMNNYNALEAFSRQEFCHLTAHQSPKASSVVHLSIVMRPELGEIKSVLDSYIRGHREANRFEQLLARYSQAPRFPLRNQCDVHVSR